MNSMRRRAFQRFATIAAIAWTAFAAPGAGASSVLPLALDEIIAESSDIAHVRCLRSEYVPDAVAAVVTVTTFVVLDRARGAAAPIFVVRQPGGTLGDLVVDYHVPKFTPGAEYVLFMPAPSRLALAAPVGLSQGAFVVSGTGAERSVGNGRDFDELLAGFDRGRLPPGIAARLALPAAQRSRMALDDFMTLVRDKAGNR
jgi:hypothetical protein